MKKAKEIGKSNELMKEYEKIIKSTVKEEVNQEVKKTKEAVTQEVKKEAVTQEVKKAKEVI